ncbi:hypothetical protein MHTCC0001_04540 [Flavobacteriaceae bacterium MHTCC 0001]
MESIIKVLLIESNPLVQEGYEKALKSITQKNPKLQFEVNKAKSYEQGMVQLKKAHKSIDVIFLDVRLLFTNESIIESGEYIALEIRNSFKKAKIIVLTSYYNTYRIAKVVKNIKPDGFLIKNDLTVHVLIDAISHVISSVPPYYSKSIIEVLNL